MSYLLDTCVLSELVAPQPNPAVLGWLRAIPEDQLYLSVLTIGELAKGIERLPGSRRRQALQAWLHDEMLPRFNQRLLPLDVDVMLAWGSLAARLEKIGRPRPAIDAMLAATAMRHNLVLVTRNVADFASAGVELFNPWEAVA